MRGKNENRRHMWAWMGLLVLGGILSVAQGTSAGPFTDIPAAMADSLDITQETAGMILSVAILTSAGLAMAVAGGRANIMATIIILLAIEGMLVAIAWLPAWVLLLTGILVAIMFGSKMASWIPGTGGDK